MSLRRLRGLKVVHISRMILLAADTILSERINRDSSLLENWCTTSKMELETYLPEGAVIEFLDQFHLLYCRSLCRVNVSFIFKFDLLGLK